MSPSQAELWERLASFPFDEPGAAFPFSRKLAREHGWSPAFTRRVIGEYRKFLFLSAAAGHAVSPSDAVDQAWHLHLTYTRSYWDELCRRVLGRPLHHVPSQGREDEGARFADWYARTLSSYREFFGEPPADIWPGLATGGAKHRRVDMRRVWIVPRPRHLSWTLAWCAAGGGLLVAAGCQFGGAGDGAAAKSIFDLTGPLFLGLFWIMMLPSALISAGVLRYVLRGPGQAGGDVSDDPYVVAWLAGGPQQAALAALCALAGRGAVSVTSADKIEVTGDITPDAHPFEKALHADARNGTRTVKGCMARAESHGAPIAEELETSRHVLAPAERSKARWRPFWVAMIPVMLGCLKIGVGLNRGKPVSFLVISCVIATVLAWMLIGRRKAWRTRAGDSALKRLRSEKAHYKKASAKVRDAEPDYAPWAVALFGVGALASTPLSTLQHALRPAQSPDSGFSGCGSSCGGGDGGGGDGGGCGGCGGD